MTAQVKPLTDEERLRVIAESVDEMGLNPKVRDGWAYKDFKFLLATISDRDEKLRVASARELRLTLILEAVMEACKSALPRTYALLQQELARADICTTNPAPLRRSGDE